MTSAIQFLLRAYKRWISPLLPHACRFVPTCSEYALEAVEQHGAVCGCCLALARLLRCHPLARAGYDPVPAQLHRPSSCCEADRTAAFAAAARKPPTSRLY